MELFQDATVEKKKRIERIYCGHLFHLGCLKTYLKTPPFAGEDGR